jgi:hypothetical protein
MTGDNCPGHTMSWAQDPESPEHGPEATDQDGDSDLFIDECTWGMKPDLTKDKFGKENNDYYQILKLVIKTYSVDVIKDFDRKFLRIEKKVAEIVGKIDWKKLKLYETLKNSDGQISFNNVKKYLRSVLLGRIINKFFNKYEKSAERVVDLIKNFYGGNSKDSKGSHNKSTDAMGDLGLKLAEDSKHKLRQYVESFIARKNPPKEYPYDVKAYEIAQRLSQLKEIKDYYTPMVNLNIPKMAQLTGFMRKDLHDYYTLFKALISVTSQRYNKDHYNIKRGIDYDTFRSGIFYIFIQSENIARKIFALISEKFSDFLDWPRFLNAMKMIKARSLENRVDLFIRIVESEGKKFDKAHVEKLCRDTLENLTREAKSPVDMGYLTEYFTKFIYQVCETEMDKEISLGKIKELITGGHPDAALLCMFCGADI